MPRAWVVNRRPFPLRARDAAYVTEAAGGTSRSDGAELRDGGGEIRFLTADLRWEESPSSDAKMEERVFSDQEQLLQFLRRLKEVFDVCDEDADGYIRVEHLEDLGLQFGQGDEVRARLPGDWSAHLLYV